MLTRSNYSICPRTCSKEVWEARCEQLQAAPDIVHTCVFRAGRKQSSEEIADRAVNTAVQSWRPRDLELQLHTHHYIEIQWRKKGKFRNASKRSMLSWGCFSLMPQLMVSIAPENLHSGKLDPPHAVQDASVPCCRMARIISDPNTPCLLCCGCVGEAAKPEMLFIPPHAVQDASVP